MNRAGWQKMARERTKDAKGLLKIKRWAAAYYLAGYAVECGLKSCIIAHLMRTDDFPDKRYSEQCWTHDLERLFVLAGLQDELDSAIAADPNLSKNWGVVKDWDESSRYSLFPQKDAVTMVEAVTNAKHEVMAWIPLHW